jgi:hypothetical protein
MALTPELTPLDRRVLEAVKDGPSQPRGIAQGLVRPPASGDWALWSSYWAAVERQKPEVVAILRGLEHLGLVKRKAGDWWVAT